MMFNLSRRLKRWEPRMRKSGEEKQSGGCVQEEGFWDQFSVQHPMFVAFNILSILHSRLSLGYETVNKIDSLPSG